MNEQKSVPDQETWLRNVIQNGGKVEAFLPQRIPLVDQALELAKLMKEINAPNEVIEELLKVASQAYRQFSTPVYIIKDKND
jgi:hypothetical protein